MSFQGDDQLQRKLVEVYDQTQRQPGLPSAMLERLRCVHALLAGAPEAIAGPRLLVAATPPYWLGLRSGRNVIGKATHNQIILAASDISAEHCCLEQHCEGWLASDLNSKNGLFINGGRTESKMLSDGDILQLGSVTLVFFNGDDPAVPRHA